MRVRFWIYRNETFVRLTLGYDGILKLYESHPTDEGYHWDSEIYWVEDGFLWCQMDSGGRDCDGPLETRCDLRCPLADCSEPPEWYEEDGYPGYHRMSIPWETVSRSQRDHYAEAAGY